MNPAGPVLRYFDSPRTQYFTIAALVAIAAAIRAYAYFVTGYPHDDALITLRYAQNWAAGLGPVFNPGERILGASSPLYLILTAIAIRLGIPPLIGAILIGEAAFIGTLLITARLAGRQFGFLSACLALAALVFNIQLHFIDAGGMETPLYQFMILLFFNSLVSISSGWRVGVIGGLLLWTRPDAVIFVAVGIAALFLIRDKRWMQVAALSLVFFTALELSMVVTYQVWAPNSVSVKYRIAAWIQEHRGIPQFEQGYAAIEKETPQGLMGVVRPFFLGSPLKIASLLLFAAGGFLAFKRRILLAAIPVSFVLYLLAFGFSHAILMPWYITAVYPIYLILAALGIGGLVARWPRAVAPTILVLVVMALFFSPQIPRRLAVSRQTRAVILEKARLKKEAATWLGETYGPDVKVASADVGYLGFYCRCQVLDLLGIVSYVPPEFRNPVLNNAKFEITALKPRLGFYYNWPGNEPILTGRESPIKTFGEPGSAQIVIYEYNYPPS